MSKKTKHLYRSNTDKILAGICGGMADYFEMDPTLVRIIWVLAGFFSLGSALLLYIILSFIIPLEPPKAS